MSADRLHTEVQELGWLDFLAACEHDPLVRVEGKDRAATSLRGKLVRFNRAVLIDTTSAHHGRSPRVHAARVRPTPWGDLEPSGESMTLSWSELDWVSWHPSESPDGRRFKVTVTGRSAFGSLTVWDDGRVVRGNEILGAYANRGLAVSAVVRGTIS